MSGVRLAHVTAGYGGPPVVVDVDLRVGSGSFTSIVGPSGCGKTTLVRTIAGFLRPSSGTITFDQREVSGPGVFVPPEKRNVGIVPQDGALFPHLDVAGNIGFGIPRGGMSDGTTVAQRVAEVLALVDLSGFESMAPHELSGGQQQRVALARALAPRPDVLLLDEPFSALDAGLRTELRSEVREVLASVGTTTILVTHDQEEALSISDQVALMIAGRIIQSGAPTDLYSEPASLDAARFLGEVVEIPATLIAPDRADTPLGVIDVVPTVEAAGVLIVRPEQLHLVPTHESSLSGGVVRSIRYQGHDSLVDVMTDPGVPMTVRVAGRARVAPGDRVGIALEGRGRVVR